MANSLACETAPYIKEATGCAAHIEIHIPCDYEYMFEWVKQDSLDISVFDRFCAWDDELDWKDDTYYYDCCMFDVYSTCIPMGLENLCWYDTNDVVPYATSNGFLYGACNS